MAKATPEGKVKRVLLDFLKSLGNDCFYYMPVQNGMGQTGIPDVMAIIMGVPFGFECKASPKQHPTVLQAYNLEKIHNAGGVAWVIDNDSIDLAITYIQSAIRDNKPLGSNVNATSALYRWKQKLEVMEFEDGTCS